jgi:Na+/glutamate symporter
MATEAPSLPPTAYVNVTDGFIEAELAEEEHEFDAISSLVLNVTIIFCLLLAYFVKKYRFYYLPESAGALLVGIIIGGIATLTTDNLQLFEFVSLVSNACCALARPFLFRSLTPSLPHLLYLYLMVSLLVTGILLLFLIASDYL